MTDACLLLTSTTRLRLPPGGTTSGCRLMPWISNAAAQQKRRGFITASQLVPRSFIWDWLCHQNDANLQLKGMFSQRSEVVYKQCRSICNSTPSAGTKQQRLVLNMHAPSPPAGLAHDLQSAHETQQSKHQLQQSQIRGRFGTGRCMTWPRTQWDNDCPLDPIYVASI